MNERHSARRPIRVLPPQVAARIAAGEVIERPASVVKELVENSLDASARRIRIEVRGGGLREIRVTDDGCGIPPEELPLAVQRHATSKLREDDLERIETLGFRGEALPSIAAVAELAIASGTADSSLGRRLVLHAGRVLADEPTAHPPGTTVTVRRLFENVPARLAAVRDERAETAEIVRTVQRLALAAPAVRFSLAIDGRPALHTSGSGSLRTVLLELYGAPVAEALRELAPVEVACARVTGLVTSPDLTRANRNHLHVVVNGRWTRPGTLLALLEAAYRPYLPRGRHPICVLVLETPPQMVDVNVHPAKLEVRLRAEREIGQAVAERLRELFARTPRTLTLHDQARALDSLRVQLAEPTTAYDDASGEIVTPAFPPLRLIGQLAGRVILLEGPDSLYLVDQHRAHERVLAERLLALATSGTSEITPLPEPILLEVRAAQLERFQRWLDRIAELGVRCEPFGPRTFVLRTFPSLPAADPLGQLVRPEELGPALLATLEELDRAEGEDWSERLLVGLACRMAIHRGRPLARSAMRALVQALGETRAPAVCPHGSPIVLRVAHHQLAQQFRW
ncbi:MAG: DNA mismatch repair endonuclease MutL [Thermomicrobium sp.]|nr:DNA mismatch repair endonuclease MutL [Thermomicrobium sp.]